MLKFEDRKDAALKLCERLKEEGISGDLIVGILRGGGYMAKIVGECLGMAWGVLPVKKISPPESPESGFGAVVYDGTNVYDEEYARLLGLDEEEIKEILKVKVSEAKVLYEKYKNFIPEDFEGKNVILIDDGMATGYTVIAGAKFVRERKPKGLILTIPVCSEFAYNLVKEFFDKIICLEVVRSIFFAVGMFYEDFRQISDEELIEFLTHH